VVNVDVVPVDFRIVGSEGQVTFGGVAPGAGVFTRPMTPANGGFQVTAATTGEGRQRTVSRRVTV
jgi:hypothetical protein